MVDLETKVKSRLDRTKEGKLDRHIIPTLATYRKLVKEYNPEAVFAAAQLQYENWSEFYESEDEDELVRGSERLLGLAERFADNCSYKEKTRR